MLALLLILLDNTTTMSTKTRMSMGDRSMIGYVDNENSFTSIMSTVPSESNTTPNPSAANSLKRKREAEAATLADSIIIDNKPLEKLQASQYNVDDAMTQIDEKWNKKRRRRNIGIMTQHMVKSAPTDNTPAEAGIIESLELYNFMCHEHFKLDFGPQTNFIIGRNGSGKSAVLTGISVALGAKATDTDRGNSLKNLIMHGRNVARAIVTLKNEGPEAYKPNEFGNRIIIERVLKMDGQHQIHIKSASNKLLSNKKKTIDHILEYFEITIANPMTILTQTEAKTFLAHSSDKDKFKSFMEGTRLQESFDNIRDIARNSTEIQQLLTKTDLIYAELAERLTAAEKVRASFRDSDDYQKRKELLLGTRVWIGYQEQQKLYAKADELLRKKSDIINANIATISTIAQEIVDMKAANANLESGRLKNLKKKVDECRDEKTAARTVVQSAKDEVKITERKIAALQQTITDNNKVIKKYESDIRKEQKRIEASSDESVDKLKHFQEKQHAKQNDLNKEKDEILSNIETMKSESSDLDGKYRGVLTELNNTVRTFENKYRDSSHQDNSNRPENSFNSQMNNLMRDLRSQRFQGSVKGPLGMHIELKKEFHSWSGVLETILNRALTSFLVSNHRDANILSSRVKFFGTGSEITVRQDEIFNYDQSRPRSKYPSILDVLKIDDENLKCFLVDSLKLHSTLLVPTRMEAQRELDADQYNLISSVFCFVDNNALRIFKKNGSFQSDPVHLSRNNIAGLRVEGDSLTARIERDLRAAQKERDDKKHEFDEKKNYFKSELKKLQSKVADIKHHIRELSQAIEKVNDKLENIAIGTTKLDSLIETKELVEADISLDIQKLEPLQAELKNAEVTVESQLQIYRSIGEDLANAEKLYREEEKQIASFNSNIVFAEGNIRDLNNNNLRLQTDVDKLAAYLTTTTQNMNNLETEALGFCTLEESLLKPGVTEQTLDQEIRNINIYLEENANKHGITKAQADLNYISIDKELKDVGAKLTESKSLSKGLSNALDKRLLNLKNSTFYTFQEVESVFVSALHIRGFRGKIEFNVAKGTLSLKVATKANAPLRSVESFSGGEKSYGQIAFLFAIWGPMHSRVRGLDEFDVFMDQINRRIALKLILSKVAENPKRQTIFITPLSVANIEGLNNKTVHIHEISPPERSNI